MSEERWEQLTEWPLTAAAVVYLGVYAWIVAQPDGPMARIGDAVLWGMWLAFACDYAVRWYLARPHWRWFFRNLHELAIVVLPMLRPLRLLRLVTMLNVLQRSVGGAFRGTGRLVAVGLMVGGIALLGAVTATLASWIIQRVAQDDEANQSATRTQVAELTAQIAALRTELAGEHKH